MAISKVTLNGDTLMDVTQDTVAANNLLSGETATGADGVRLTGTLIPSSEPVLQAKTVTPTSSEQVIVPDGYACTPSTYTSNAQSYSAGAMISSAVFFYSGALIEEQNYRVLGRLDVVDASGTVLEYYDIDSEFIWNTTYQDVLINGATEYVQYLKLGKGSAYNRVNLSLKLNLAGTFGFTLKIYFYEENASYDGLSQVTVNPIPSQYIVPSGTKTITENGTGIDVASYASVDVNVSGGGGGGGGGFASDDVLFIDYDGTIVDSYSAADFANLSALPSNPSHSGLTAQGWNWSLSDAKTYVSKYGQLTIGQMYITDDGKTRIYIHLGEGRTSPMLGCCPNGTVVVDWGDGTTTDTLTGTSTSTVKWTPAHSYASAGDYVIKLTTTGSVGFTGSSSNNAHSYILRYASGADSKNRVYQNSVQSIELGSGVSISSYAFFDCTSLSSISVPNSITSIGARAFYNCYRLSGFTMPSGVTSTGDYSFNSCYTLCNISIPRSVTSIGTYAFMNCRSLNMVSIPDNVTSIATNVFSTCNSLSRVSIPDGITSIGNYAFASCFPIRSISIPSGVTNIGNSAFAGCSALYSISIPSSVTSIGTYAFNNCQSLPSISIPSGVTSIGSYTFASCTNMHSIVISDGVTSIGGNAFTSCFTLSSISIPSSVTSIGSAFGSTYGLSAIHFLSATPPTVTAAGAWYELPTDCKIYVPTGTLSAYTSAANYPDPATYTYIEE